MNKHLKPGVAVDVRGANDEDVQAVIEACARLGLNMAKLDSGKGFIVLPVSGGNFWECSYQCGLPTISINQALGRESEAEKNDQSGFASRCVIVGKSNASNDWFERGELPPVGTVCEVSIIGDDSFEECEIIAHIKQPAAWVAVFTREKPSKEKIVQYFTASSFRPLKTEKEKFVELALSIDCDPSGGMLSRHDYAARLYDKGLRFTE